MASTTVFSAVAGKDATKKYDKYHGRGILGQEKHRQLKIGLLDTALDDDQKQRGFKGLFNKLFH